MLSAERNKGLIVRQCRRGVVGTIAADSVAHAFDEGYPISVVGH